MIISNIKNIFLMVRDYIIVFLYLRGIKLSSIDAVKTRLSAESLANLQREILIREIKSGGFIIQNYPIWLSFIIEKIMVFMQRNKTFFLLSVKFVFGLGIIFVLIFIFVLIRGVLPVPSRIPPVSPNFVLSKNTNFRSDTLFDIGDGYEINRIVSIDTDILINNILNNDSTIKIQKVQDNDAKELLEFKIGESKYSRKFRGFIVTNDSPLRIINNKQISTNIYGKSKLRFQFLRLPTGFSDNICELELRDINNEVLIKSQVDFGKNINKLKNHINSTIEQRLAPRLERNNLGIYEVTIEMDEAPKSLLFSANPINKNIKTSMCSLGIGNFSFEQQQIGLQKQRGLLIIVVDGLGYSISNDFSLMPNLSNFFDKESIKFARHFSTSNESTMATSSIFTAKPYRSMDADSELFRKNLHPILTNIPNFPNIARMGGYKTVAIGHVEYADSNIWNEAIEIKNRSYDTRSITEEAQNWLEKYGESPFVMYLHYTTLTTPFRPPFSDIRLSNYALSPFGISGEKELQNGLARFWDREFGLIINKLSDMGIDKSIGIMVVGNYGTQMAKLKYNNIIDFPLNIAAASRSRSVLTTEELHVPLYFKLPNDNNEISTEINCLTTHLDITPMVIDFVSKKLNYTEYLSKIKQKCLNNKQNDVVYFDGENMSGIMKRKHNNIMDNYLWQFDVQNITLFSDGFPWRKKSKLMPREIWAQANILTNQEDMLPLKLLPDIKQMREDFLSKSLLSHYVTLEAVSDINFDLTLFYNGPLSNENFIKFVKKPVEVHLVLKPFENKVFFSGSMRKGELLIFSAKRDAYNLTNILAGEKYFFYGCQYPNIISDKFLVKILTGISCLKDTPALISLNGVNSYLDKGFLVHQYIGDWEVVDRATQALQKRY